MKWPVQIKVSDDAARPLVEAVVGAFSPATEPLAWMGDGIRYHRIRSAIKCFTKAKAFAVKHGLKLKSPPAKFLAQYIENCSLEEEKDEQLIEWWARLLVDASTNYDAKHAFYTSVLKQVSGVELELLEVLVRNSAGTYRLENVEEADYVHDFGFHHGAVSLSNLFTDKNIAASIKEIRRWHEGAGRIAVNIFVDDASSNQWQEVHPDYADEETSSWQVLQSLSLARLEFLHFTADEVEYRVQLAMITNLGAQFYFSCHEKGWGKRLSSKTRFKRKLMKIKYPKRRPKGRL